jgi:hypothetical protein
MINTIIQIILSIFLISIMAFIGYSVYNNEFLSNVVLTNTNRKITKVFTGILDYSKDIDIDFETYDKNDYSYLDINPSINQNGGAEYSYNFWIFFTFNGASNNIISDDNDIHKTLLTTYKNTNGSVKLDSKYIILFYKGEKQSVLISNNNGYECNSKEHIVEPTILVKNPLIKIRNDAKEIVVEFNSIYDLFTVRDVEPSSPTYRQRIAPNPANPLYAMNRFLSPPNIDASPLNVSLTTWSLRPSVQANYIFLNDTELIHIAKTDHSFIIKQIDLVSTFGQHGPSKFNCIS